MDKARVETDPATRLKLYTQAEQLLCVEDAGTMALFYPVRAQMTKPGIKRTFSLTALEHYWDWDIAR